MGEGFFLCPFFVLRGLNRIKIFYKNRYKKSQSLLKEKSSQKETGFLCVFSLFIKLSRIAKIIRRKGVLVRGFFLGLFLYSRHKQNQSLFEIGNLPKF